jgi:hypothetical protein
MGRRGGVSGRRERKMTEYDESEGEVDVDKTEERWRERGKG